MLEEYVRDNYFAGFTLPDITAAKKFTLFLDKVNVALKDRSIVPGHGVCLKSMSKAITMQDFTLQAITAAEIHT